MIIHKSKKFIFIVVIGFLLFVFFQFTPGGQNSILRHHSIIYLCFADIFIPCFGLYYIFSVLPGSFKINDEGISSLYVFFQKEYEAKKIIQWDNIESISYNWPWVFIRPKIIKDKANVISFNVFQFDYKSIISLILKKNNSVLIDRKLKDMCG